MSDGNDARRTRLILIALWLTWASIVWGTMSGVVSVTVGLLDGSLEVLGLGLNVLACDQLRCPGLALPGRASARRRGANVEREPR